jgi:chemotaxis protein methyltransferase CheR
MLASNNPNSLLIAMLQEKTGQLFSSNRHWRIDMVLKPILKKHNFADLAALALHLKSDRGSGLAQECVEAMINNETCFFRDQASFALLTGPLFDAVREKREASKTIRIWSAACSTGQEAYSLAISFAENFEKWRDWNIVIYASDVSMSAINKARLGRYSQFEIQRGLPVRMMLKYFTQDGEDWQANEDLCKKISFRSHNQLQAAAHLGKFDIILCRNMLMYLSDVNKDIVLDNLQAALRPDGYLMLGAAETILGARMQFTPSQDFRGFYEAASSPTGISSKQMRA